MLIREFSVEDQIKEYLATGVGFSGESFDWSFKGSDQAIFTGSVGLPNIGVQDMVDGANHWGQLLGRVRSEVLPDAEWEVRIENEPMLWNLFDLVFHIEWDEAPADQTVALARIDETTDLVYGDYWDPISRVLHPEGGWSKEYAEQVLAGETEPTFASHLRLVVLPAFEELPAASLSFSHLGAAVNWYDSFGRTERSLNLTAYPPVSKYQKATFPDGCYVQDGGLFLSYISQTTFFHQARMPEAQQYFVREYRADGTFTEKYRWKHASNQQFTDLHVERQHIAQELDITSDLFWQPRPIRLGYDDIVGLLSQERYGAELTFDPPPEVGA